MRHRNPLNLKRSLPCMSWSPKNLYNLWRRTVGPESTALRFKVTTDETLFQQRWRSKAAVRAYHGEYIPEKVFKRWYLPDTLPDVRPRRRVFADDKNDLEEYAKRRTRAKELERKQAEEIEQKGLAPVGSLMFLEVERRLDVFLFRCCFVHSVYEARRLIIHGYVKLNGKKHSKANTRLAPGDMVSVDPDAIRFLKPPHGPIDHIVKPGSSDVEDRPAAPIETAEESDSNSPSALEAEAAEVLASSGAESPTTEASFPEAEVSSSSETEISTLLAKPTAEDTKPTTEEANPGTEEAGIETVPSSKKELTPFHLPQYASPWLFIPAYIEVNFKTCSAIYVRNPTARPGYSEIPTPYDADGAVIRYAWEWPHASSAFSTFLSSTIMSAAATLVHLPRPRPDHGFTKPPSSKLGIFFWRCRMWFESTFVLSMLEPWEKVLLLTVLGFLFTLLFSGVFMYLPHHLKFLQQRAVYYLWGQEGDERLLWQWLGSPHPFGDFMSSLNSRDMNRPPFDDMLYS
ncbi:hypothetical protein CVT26_016076 [Gymnopilus dilepis]|uniref:RNA-binding S4 domain-containing protein n=1 Tax=Gymnopilus dilepis TaxID=231916 RepID=A0A409YDX9_9AGAR|nr:hypothetical protein CVT26_016076 [Gymnopilus dilepis]